MALIIFLFSVAGVLAAVFASPCPARNSSVSVVARYPHDTKAFTQGLEYSRGHFWESTGLVGRSSLRRVSVTNGSIAQRFDFRGENLVFGEGMTLVRDAHIMMVSWKDGRGFVFNKTSLEIVRQWRYEGEGWGLAYNKRRDEVWMSNGTAVLSVLNRKTLQVKRTVRVTRDGKEVALLNELEWVCGELWANVLMSKDIVRINPRTGRVLGIVRADNLPLEQDVTPRDNVLNGIAFDENTGRLWLTGKLWSKVYEVNVHPLPYDLATCST